MKRQIKKTIAILLTVCFVLSITAATVSAKEKNLNPGVVPVESRFSEKTYEELSINWWKWANSIPKSSNPLNAGNGPFDATVGQSGNVWFLAGSYVGTVERDCTIPTGKAIFFPIINIVATKDETENFNTIEKLRHASKVLIDDVKIKEVIIDGKCLKDLDDYRVGSRPFLFTKFPKDNNILGLSGPTPAVSDGYWIMLKPLSEGKHTLRIHGKIDSDEYGGYLYETDVTYNLNVMPKRC